MTDKKPAADVTKDWQATQGQKSAATRLRLFAALSWIVAIGGEIAGVVLLYRHKFDHGNLPLLIGILVGIAIFAIAGNLLWKAANKHDPARASDTFRFFFQNQLGAIITIIAFLPLVLLRALSIRNGPYRYFAVDHVVGLCRRRGELHVAKQLMDHVKDNALREHILRMCPELRHPGLVTPRNS